MDGYCMFSHVAVAACYAQQKHHIGRVFMVDWDVHHGQETQFTFNQNPSVLYFFMHHYEQSRSWPHLKASNWSTTGFGQGQGYNINMPWNQVGMRDADYIAAFLHILLLVVLEFQPQLVLVAAGFDTLKGDPKNGYNLRALAEGISASLHTLLGDPCPILESSGARCQSVQASVSCALEALEPFWEVLVRSTETMEGDNVEEDNVEEKAELFPCHSAEYVAHLQATEKMKTQEPYHGSSNFDSIYICPSTFACAQLAIGAACRLVEAMLSGEVLNGAAVAISGRALQILIMDWDVHHGNGTQHMFEDDHSVLYVSLNRYDHGTFFPIGDEGASSQIGQAAGAGFTVNVAWNGPRIGDADYLAAWHHLVFPTAYEFNSELVLVSSGFDTAWGDLQGSCQVLPEAYAHLTHLLMGLTSGCVILILEGGYSLTSISKSVAAYTCSLIGDPPPLLTLPGPPLSGSLASITETIQVHHRYWHSLWVMKVEDKEEFSSSKLVTKKAPQPAKPRLAEQIAT
ncbi:Histone deacetylase 6 [Plecturocebus cupreus]